MELLTILLALASSALAVKIDRRQTPDTIPGQWIATLKDDSALGDVLNSVQTLASTTGLLGNVLGGFETLYKYDLAGFKGFAFNGDDAVLDALSAIGAIESIEPDSIVRAYAPVAAQNETAGVQAAFVSQSGAPWGLGRISRRTKGSTTYTYDNSAGSGAYAYVIDTGINSAHVEFEGRATQAVNFISGESNADLNGHGTHCAGTIGSKTYGVAKKINLIGVKVLSGSGSGSTSGIIAGIQWAVKNAQDNGRVSRSVLSMSLGGSYSSSFNSAVASAIQSGLFVAVAAGNDNDDSAYYSPASETTACTVGASDINDNKASFSNYGSVVDIFGPGVNILSTWIGSTTATKSISGTSMATPHIAGLAAYLIILEGARSPQNLCSYIATSSTKNVLVGLPSGTKNLLAYNLSGL